MKRYPWLYTHFEKLITDYQSGRGYHALLIQSLSGMGDDVLIYFIAQFLMCHFPERNKSCGKCRSCQLMKSGTHPDYYKLDKNACSIESVRDINEKLYEYARLNGEKVVWIEDATLLTEASTNALLKILEEPPKKTWFFLSCRESKYLLATLRSRCRIYIMTVPQEEHALIWLQQEMTVSQCSAITALRLCDGAPIAALELLQGNCWIHRSQICLALDNALESCDWLGLLLVLNHDQAPVNLQWMIALFLDALKIQNGISVITNIDVCPLLTNIAKTLSNKILHTIIRALCQYREQLLTITGLNREIMLTDLLLTIEHYLQSDTVLPNTIS